MPYSSTFVQLPDPINDADHSKNDECLAMDVLSNHLRGARKKSRTLARRNAKGRVELLYSLGGAY